MALPHAQHLDVINVAPLGDKLSGSVSTSLIKTGRLQLLHLVLPAHYDQPQHHVDEECTIHCLEGECELVTGAGAKRLRPGNVVVLPAKQQHALRARTDCTVLLTLVLRDGDAGNQGGAGHRVDRAGSCLPGRGLAAGFPVGRAASLRTVPAACDEPRCCACSRDGAQRSCTPYETWCVEVARVNAWQ